MIRLHAAAIVALVIGGCATAPSLTVRPSGSVLAQGAHPASFRVSEAQAHLALGNVALAAEGFRRALRDEPDSVAALTGLATCYDRMGRFDLSRDHYERALALAPNDLGIFERLAASLEKAGTPNEAAELRREIAARRSPAASEVTSLAALVRTLDEEKAFYLSKNGQALRVAPQPAATLAQTLHRSGPRLERADVGEVVLVTTGGPHWQPLPSASRLASAVKRVPPGQAETAQITILNAGTADGLASRTRTRLQKLGWTKIAIANAARQLQRSELHYPPSLEREGKRLAQSLPVPVRAVRSQTVDRIVVRLGLDAGSAKGRT